MTIETMTARVLLVAGLCLGGSACRDDTNILTADQPSKVLTFEVQSDSGVTLWRVRSDRPVQLWAIRYGEIPGGFVQDVPAGGARPTPLHKGDSLTIITVMEDRTLRHKGVATSVSGFRG